MWGIRGLCRGFAFKGTLPADPEAMRRVIMYRCTHVGMLEAEILLRDWAQTHLPTMSHSELQAFHDEVLEVETPDIFAYLTGKQPVPDTPYLQQLRAYVLTRGIK
jgi:succinate dehydrogenase flavin-adding protein (antitoxin of CptAB toxin-antitoxin module)